MQILEGPVDCFECAVHVEQMNGAADDTIAVGKFFATNIALVTFGVLVTYVEGRSGSQK